MDHLLVHLEQDTARHHATIVGEVAL
jgi:hypothetical protein